MYAKFQKNIIRFIQNKLRQKYHELFRQLHSFPIRSRWSRAQVICVTRHLGRERANLTFRKRKGKRKEKWRFGFSSADFIWTLAGKEKRRKEKLLLPCEMCFSTCSVDLLLFFFVFPSVSPFESSQSGKLSSVIRGWGKGNGTDREKKRLWLVDGHSRGLKIARRLNEIYSPLCRFSILLFHSCHPFFKRFLPFPFSTVTLLRPNDRRREKYSLLNSPNFGCFRSFIVIRWEVSSAEKEMSNALDRFRNLTRTCEPRSSKFTRLLSTSCVSKWYTDHNERPNRVP